MADVWSETADGYDHFGRFKFSQRPGKFEKVKRLFQRERLDALALFKRGKFRLGFGIGISHLNHGSVPADFYKYIFPVFRVFSQELFTAHLPGVFKGSFDMLVKRELNLPDHLVPYHPALCDLIELLFHTGGEIIIEDVVKMLYQEVVHNGSDIRGEKF